jgi:hypothetical protein
MIEDIEKIKGSVKETLEFIKTVKEYLNTQFGILGPDSQIKTIEEWKKFFKIEIPEHISLQQLVELSAKAANKYQEASDLRERETTTLAILEQSRQDKYHTAYNETRRESEAKYNKPLAAESCKNAALLVVKELEQAINTQKVTKDFWSKTCESLTEVRKHLELISYALGAEIRNQRDIIIKAGN